jgi:hypothetical protein
LTPEPLDTIREATKGLTYPSESDYPLDAVSFPASAATAHDALQEIADRRGNVETIPPQTFWKELEGVDGAEGFVNLRRVMETNLTSLSVVRIGQAKIDVYVLGRAKSGQWIGFHTVSVET